MLARKLSIFLAVAGATGAVSITDWASVNGSNAAYYLRQKEDGKRWTWDILQTEFSLWRFVVGGEVEFNHPRKLAYETYGVEDPEGDELIQRYLRYHDDHFDLRAGTYDKTFGKGLTLRSYEDRDFDVRQRLDGGLADVNVAWGERQWGDFSLLWGRNDRRDLLNQTEPDEVMGGEITFRPFEFVYVTGSGVKSEVENTVLREMEDVELYGAGLGAITKYADAYAEYAVRQGYCFNTFDEREGSGLYGVATAYLPRLALTAEYKRYDKLGYPYNNAPPVSVDARMLTGGTSGPSGEWGYYARLTANPWDDLRVGAGYSYADDKVGDQTEKTNEIKEVLGQARYDFAFGLAVEPKYEYLSELHFIGETKTGELERTPSLRVSYNPWENHGFSAEVEAPRRMVYTVDEAFQDYGAAVGYNYASWLGLTARYETTDEEVQELVDPGDPLHGVEPTYRNKSDWLWGEVRLSWYHPRLQNHVFTIGMGSERGGLVCSSGVCKTQAPFSGWKVGWESTF